MVPYKSKKAEPVVEPKAEIVLSYFKGSGPGGQNRNKRMTGVRAKDLITGTSAMATERRSQLQNQNLAIQRLYDKLEEYYHVPVPRIPTRKPKSSVRQRLGDKRQISDRKQGRQKKISYDD